ncbi:MAG: glycosyltransferase family 39 protein [bacterium]
MKSKYLSVENLTSPNAILFYLSIFKFLLVLIFAGNYGLFRDEYYYIACSKNLAWGFVDQPPFNALMLALSRMLFGESLLAIRILAYIAGAAIVFVSGLITREFGGGKFAQFLTGLTVIFSGVVLGNSGYFSMNVFDILFSSIMFYYLIKLLKTGNKKLWITIGIICGVGLMNKLSFLFLGFGLVVGLLFTKNRKYFLTKELWIGGAIAVLMFLPNVIWQIVNDFPTLEFMHNATMYKNTSMGIGDFAMGALLELNPGYVLFVFTALYFLFINRAGREFAAIGWLFVSVFLVFVFNNGKPYYMGVLYPAMLAAGIVGADCLIERYLRNWVRPLLLVLLIPSMAFVTPFAIPILEVDTFVKYSEWLGIKPASGERSELGILPQFYADRFGWEEMVQKVADVYNGLPDEEKKKALIFGQNYGEAGAIDYYGKKYGLPQAISSHNNYALWGYPEEFDGSVLIVIGSNLEDNSGFFEEVKLAASHYNKYGMPFENIDIFICRKPKMSFEEIWKRIKHFI